jgi:UDP-glucose 4-epimerase
MYCGIFGINHTILRPSNVYGEGQRLNIGQGVIGVMADRTLRGERLEVWGSGENLRDYLHVDDLVDATMMILNYDADERVFNVSSGRGRSVLDVIRVLRTRCSLDVQFDSLPDRGFDVPTNVLSHKRIWRATGWQPKVEFEDGVARLVEWLRTQT